MGLLPATLCVGMESLPSKTLFLSGSSIHGIEVPIFYFISNLISTDSPEKGMYCVPYYRLPQNHSLQEKCPCLLWLTLSRPRAVLEWFDFLFGRSRWKCTLGSTQKLI